MKYSVSIACIEDDGHVSEEHEISVECDGEEDQTLGSALGRALVAMCHDEPDRDTVLGWMLYVAEPRLPLFRAAAETWFAWETGGRHRLMPSELSDHAVVCARPHLFLAGVSGTRHVSIVDPLPSATHDTARLVDLDRAGLSIRGQRVLGRIHGGGRIRIAQANWLQSLTLRALAEVSGCGKTTMREIVSLLCRHGIHLDAAGWPAVRCSTCNTGHVAAAEADQQEREETT